MTFEKVTGFDIYCILSNFLCFAPYEYVIVDLWAEVYDFCSIFKEFDTNSPNKCKVHIIQGK